MSEPVRKYSYMMTEENQMKEWRNEVEIRPLLTNIQGSTLETKLLLA